MKASLRSPCPGSSLQASAAYLSAYFRCCCREVVLATWPSTAAIDPFVFEARLFLLKEMTLVQLGQVPIVFQHGSSRRAQQAESDAKLIVQALTRSSVPSSTTLVTPREGRASYPSWLMRCCIRPKDSNLTLPGSRDHFVPTRQRDLEVVRFGPSY